MLTSRPVDRKGAFAIMNGMFYMSARAALELLDQAEAEPEKFHGKNSVVQVSCRPALGSRFFVRYNPSNHDPRLSADAVYASSTARDGAIADTTYRD